MSLAFIFASVCGIFVAAVLALVVAGIIVGLRKEMRYKKEAQDNKRAEPE